MGMNATGYAAAWTREEDLTSLNQRIHDGVPLDQLMARARAYRGLMFETFYPIARPQPGQRVMEFGSGVGWLMEAMLEAFPGISITGLDISENMAQRGRERLPDPRASFVVYDGFTFPFADGAFDIIYSCAAIQHIEKHVAFLLFRELYRSLAPGGHAVLHLMSVHHLPHSTIPYDVECWNHIKNVPTHWHHYYAFDELFVLFSQLIGVDELDIQPSHGNDTFFVHFSKQTGRRFLRPELETLTFPAMMLERERQSTRGWRHLPGRVLKRLRG
jgi:ubiquinone/menaquinone biosynthesis C-methylase UbiE